MVLSNSEPLAPPVKVNYVQAAPPSSPSEGEMWYETDTGIFRIYESGGWRNAPPVQVTEEASTFTESDVTVTHNRTAESSGHLELGSDATSGDALVEWDSGVPADIKSYDLATFQATEDGETVTIDVEGTNYSFPDDFEDGNADGWTGDAGSLSVVTSPALDGTYSAQLESNNASNLVSSPTVGGVTKDAKFLIQLSSITASSLDETNVYFFDSGGTSIGYVRFEHSTGNIQWRNNNIGATWSPNTTYEVELRWDFPNNQVDIYIDGVEIATNLAFESAGSDWNTVDVLNQTNNSGESSTTTFDSADTVLEEFTDINQNFDISTIGADKNVKLRANLSRTDTSNNPTVDYLARRFTR